MESRSDDASRQKVFDLIADIKVAQMVTIDSAGKMRARPMVAQSKPHDHELWFFTSGGSGKIDEIQSHHDVMLTYSDPRSQNYVSILAKTEVIKDKDKVRELWTEAMRVWFPKGIDDPDIALLKVEVREADYWDSPSSSLVHVYGYAKAVVTGQRPDPGDNKHVSFKS